MKKVHSNNIAIEIQNFIKYYRGVCNDRAEKIRFRKKNDR